MPDLKKPIDRALVRVRMRAPGLPTPKSLAEISPVSSEYFLQVEAFPLKEFTTPVLILAFLAGSNRFPHAQPGYSRPVKAYDVIEIEFLAPVLPSNHLLVVPVKELPKLAQEFEAMHGKKPHVFTFTTSALALLSLYVA